MRIPAHGYSYYPINLRRLGQTNAVPERPLAHGPQQMGQMCGIVSIGSQTDQTILSVMFWPMIDGIVDVLGGFRISGDSVKQDFRIEGNAHVVSLHLDSITSQLIGDRLSPNPAR